MQNPQDRLAFTPQAPLPGIPQPEMASPRAESSELSFENVLARFQRDPKSLQEFSTPVDGANIIVHGDSTVPDWQFGSGIGRKILFAQHVRKGFMLNYLKIREFYPDLYPPLEFELQIITTIKQKIKDYVQDRESYAVWDLRMAVNGLRVDDLLNSLLNASASDVGDRLERMPGEGDIEAALRNFLGGVSVDSMFYELVFWIIQQYNAAGYTWRYFMFYNARSPAAQVGLGNVPLMPDIFEAGAAAFPLDRYPQDWNFVAEGNTTSNAAYPWENTGGGTRAPPFSSWNKHMLLQAIVNSGLVVRFPKTNQASKTVALPRARVNLPDRERGRYKQYLGIHLENSHLPREIYNRSDVSTNLFAYTALYRKLFNTMIYVDWTKAFQMGILSENQYPMLAKEFALNPGLPKQELIRRVQEISAKRTQMAREIASLVPLQAQAVTYQPNSAWLKPVTRYQFADAGLEITQPYQQYVAVKAWCADDNISKETLLRQLEVTGMVNLLPPALLAEEYSKEDVCSYLLETLGYQASKYEGLFLSCNDPDVNIQSILNTLEVMELKFLVKDVDFDTISKDELCTIINNYLNLLLEAKAKTVARAAPL